LDREELLKQIRKYLRFWVTPRKQIALSEFLLNLPCQCSSAPQHCDRHWLIDTFRYSIERKMKTPQAIVNFLQADYESIDHMKHQKSLCVLPPGKYILTSDLHQGAFAWSWDMHDFFWKNKEIYLTLLKYYFKQGFTLIELGDIEDFWLKRVLSSFDDQWKFQLENFSKLYEIRRKFHLNHRYIKIRGNHDNIWLRQDKVEQYLRQDAQLQNLKIFEFATIGDQFLLMHGHQADPRNRDIDSGKGVMWTKIGAIIEFFTDTALFGMKKPATGWQNHPQSTLIHSRKIEHDIYNKEKLNEIYATLAKSLKTYLIIGHNHAPKFLPEGDLTFNTGCGVFEGVIYGIEINYDSDSICLVDWNDDHGLPSAPLILEKENLSNLKFPL